MLIGLSISFIDMSNRQGGKLKPLKVCIFYDEKLTALMSWGVGSEEGEKRGD